MFQGNMRNYGQPSDDFGALRQSDPAPPMRPADVPAVGANMVAPLANVPLSVVIDGVTANWIQTHPAPFAVASASDLAKLTTERKGAWLAWFMSRPDVIGYMKVRDQLTGAAVAEINSLVDKLDADVNLQGAQAWATAGKSAASSSAAEIWKGLDDLCAQFHKMIQQSVFKASKLLGTNADLGWGASENWQAQGWGAAVYQAKSGKSYTSVAEIPDSMRSIIGAAQVPVPVLVLPAVPGLDATAKTLPITYLGSVKQWPVQGKPWLAKLQAWLTHGWLSNANESPPLYQDLADFWAAKMVPAIAAAQVAWYLDAPNSPYSWRWANGDIQNILQPTAATMTAKVNTAKALREKRTTQTASAAMLLPEGFVRTQAEAIGNQKGLLVVAQAQVNAGNAYNAHAKVHAAQSAFIAQIAAAAVNLQLALPAFDDFNLALAALVKAAFNFGTALTAGATQEAQSGADQAVGAASNLDVIKSLIAESGAAAVDQAEVNATAAAADTLKKESANLIKKIGDIAAAWKLIKANSEAAAGGRVTVPAPALCQPSQVPLDGGTQVIVEGAFFEQGATVSVGSTPVDTLRLSATQLQFTAPAGTAPGKVSITVTNPSQDKPAAGGGTVNTPAQTATLNDALEYVPGSSGSILPWLIAAGVAVKFFL